ncbi:MAG TPA: prepilin-type N-terminal cleavage/methylation domain-containing protein [Gammaproteobacteria bacterium]|nr:prepilin-type N-terminal cleavage/methylation domain-containing protein [Gammaproteobacteria bacterium]
MDKGQNPARNRGFSLVELLIVVIILAILAAIVVPQFADTTTDARDSAIDSNLAAMRSAIQLYRQQHGVYPGDLASTGATCPAGSVAGTGAVDTLAAFTDQLTRYTNILGQSCTGTNATFNLGPYLREIPINPANNLATVEMLTTGVLGLPAPNNSHGWIFDVVTGELASDST